MNQHPEPSCRYHGETQGHWYCGACHLSLCTDCKPFAERLPDDVPCPLCGENMSEPGAGQRLPTADKQHPLGVHYSVWATTATLALIAALVPWPLPGLIAAVPAGFFLLAEMTLIARSAGEAWSDRRILPQLLVYEQLEFVLQSLGFALPFIAAWLIALGAQSVVLMFLVMSVATVLLPATLISTLVAGGAWDGLRPNRFLAVMRTLGRAYVGLVAATAAPMFLIWVAAIGLRSIIPLPVLASILAVAGSLYALIWSQRIGALTYRNRRVLEYPAGVAAIDRPKRPSADQYEPAQLLADADTLIAEGRAGQARTFLAEALTRYPDQRALNDRFERLLRDTADAKTRERYLERRMQRLFKAGQSGAAAQLWQRNSPSLNNWLPRLPATRYRLALELEHLEDYQTAFRLLVSLPLKGRGIGTPGAAWLAAAAILESHLGDPEGAKRLRLAVTERTGKISGRSTRRRTPGRRTDTRSPTSTADNLDRSTT